MNVHHKPNHHVSSSGILAAVELGNENWITSAIKSRSVDDSVGYRFLLHRDKSDESTGKVKRLHFLLSYCLDGNDPPPRCSAHLQDGCHPYIGFMLCSNRERFFS